ncbi:hypothetical protein AAG906_011678 [Vitis piasezkii]
MCKINQKNTWELKLIDHLSEIIRVDAEEDTETNFQKASCTLEAGVKIYSLRVDSVHSEAYKILGGINRAGLVNEQGGGDNNNNRDDEGHSKKEPDRKISPLSTLESSFEALNVKRFDVAFTMDPLYHQTSAQFDGVKGLLLNNLAVYGGCRVLFDSLEVPGKFILCSSENNSSDMQMVMNMLEKNEISPTLRDIITGSVDENHVEFNGNPFGNYEAWTFNHDNGAAVTDDGFTFGDPTIHSHYEGNDSYTSYEPDVDDRLENVATFLFQGLGFTSKKNAWAEPDVMGLEFQLSGTARPARYAFQCHYADWFRPAMDLSGEQLQLPTSLCRRWPSSFSSSSPQLVTSSPNLTGLCLGKRRRQLPAMLCAKYCTGAWETLVLTIRWLFCLEKYPERIHWLCVDGYFVQFVFSDAQEHNDDDRLPSWDNGSVFNCQYDDGYADSDVENLDILVSQPCQVCLWFVYFFQ